MSFTSRDKLDNPEGAVMGLHYIWKERIVLVTGFYT